MNRLFIAVAVMLSVAASVWPQEKFERDAVLQLLHDQAAAWNRGDLKGFMNTYWNSPELSFYSGRDKRKGWQETYERFRQRYQADGREMGQLTFSELIADRLSNDRMMVRGRWKLDMKAETHDGLFTLIVEKKPEGWRIIHDHTSAGESMKKSP